MGGITSTPVINRPEVAIIAVNKVEEKPVVIDGELEIRKRMNLSLSCDHRVVDGWDAAKLPAGLKKLIENPLRLLHPPRQPRPRQRGRAEGRRPPGELERVDDGDHGRALLRRARAQRPGRGEAARRPGASRHPLSARLARTATTLENFRGFGGAQSYPSRTKDRIPVDFSTGSVGLGVAVTLFASLVQDWLSARGWWTERPRGRFVALMGDAELDEGNIYEALIEGHKHDVRNLWWIVDYNRQSLDATSADRMFERFDDIFRTCGWRVVELRHGKRLAAALASIRR
jgi:hypothetical protein